jgi:hypothetical protein
MSSTSSLQRLVEDYLADCRARGLSPKTLRDAYGYPLHKVLLPWCEEQGLTQAGQLADGRGTAAVVSSARDCFLFNCAFNDRMYALVLGQEKTIAI